MRLACLRYDFICPPVPWHLDNPTGGLSTRSCRPSFAGSALLQPLSLSVRQELLSSDKWSEHRSIIESSVFQSVRARWERSKKTNNSDWGEQSCLPSDSLMCTSAHGNNRLIKSDQKKKNNVDVAPGHRSREKLRWCVPLFSFLQLFYFSDPPQANTKHFTLCGQSIIATWMDASGFILRPWKEVSKRTRRVAEANDSGALMMARFKEDESIVHQAAGRGADILLHRRLVCVVNYIPL